MNRKHITGISLLIALAAIAGLIAVVRTTGIAANDGAATDALVSARTKQLDRAESGLRSEIARLNATVAAPAPTTAGTDGQGSTMAPAADAAERVVYVRPAPIVRSASGDDHGSDEHGESDEQSEPADHHSGDSGSYEDGDDD